jgi:hypothetical protein
MTELDAAQQRRAYRVPEDERRCTAIKADGSRCRASRARGGELCAGHAGLGVAAGGDVARAAQQLGAKGRSALRREARVLAVMTPRERMNAAIAQRVDDGRILRALDRGLASGDDRVAVQTAEGMLDRLLGKPTSITETQLPGTQQYTELRSTLASLPPSDRLAYLREARMAAEVATHSVDPAQDA